VIKADIEQEVLEDKGMIVSLEKVREANKKAFDARQDYEDVKTQADQVYNDSL